LFPPLDLSVLKNLKDDASLSADSCNLYIHCISIPLKEQKKILNKKRKKIPDHLIDDGLGSK